MMGLLGHAAMAAPSGVAPPGSRSTAPEAMRMVESHGCASAATVVLAANSETIVAADGSPVERNLRIGDKLIVRWERTPGTGYKWQINAEASSNIALIALTDLGWAAFEPPAGQNPVIGGPGHHSFEIEAVAAGSVLLVFDYSRPWENKAPARRQSIELTISGS
ncbi:MAG: hypothetical protein GC150_17050 [Rhizobiales bacterium]|nr:hypothetical protein [Hyphomicrobiales bacterium]